MDDDNARVSQRRRSTHRGGTHPAPGSHCDDSNTQAPASCPNPDPPANGTRGEFWKDPLPSGSSNMVRCDTGYTATNDGLNTCINGELISTATCRPSACANTDVPTHGRQDANWRSVLQSGEFNQVLCDEGYEPTNDGKTTCQNGVLTVSTCKRQPNWVFYEKQSCSYAGSHKTLSFQGAYTDANQFLKACKSTCVSLQCSGVVFDQSMKTCMLQFATTPGDAYASSPATADKPICAHSDRHDSWVLQPPQPKACPTPPPATLPPATPPPAIPPPATLPPATPPPPATLPPATLPPASPPPSTTSDYPPSTLPTTIQPPPSLPITPFLPISEPTSLPPPRPFDAPSTLPTTIQPPPSLPITPFLPISEPTSLPPPRQFDAPSTLPTTIQLPLPLAPPTSGMCYGYTDPENGYTNTTCPYILSDGESCLQFCNRGYSPRDGNLGGRCNNGRFQPITCDPMAPPPTPIQPPPSERRCSGDMITSPMNGYNSPECSNMPIGSSCQQFCIPGYKQWEEGLQSDRGYCSEDLNGNPFFWSFLTCYPQ